MYAGLDVEAMYDLAGRASRAVVKRLQGSSQEDLEQDGIEWMLANEERIKNWHDTCETDTMFQGKLFKSVYHHMLEVAQKEKAERTGYLPQDNFYYSVGMIRKLLPLYYMDKIASITPGMAEELDLPDRDIYLDFDRALRIVRDDIRTVLYQWFGEDRDLEELYCELQDVYNVSNEGARKKVYRVVKQLQEALGGEQPAQFEGRKSVSNAAARAITARAWGD